jgi:hypothetical protein
MHRTTYTYFCSLYLSRNGLAGELTAANSRESTSRLRGFFTKRDAPSTAGSAAQLLAEAGKPPIHWPGAEAPASACATASRQLQFAPAERSLVAATAAPRRVGVWGGLQLS